MIEVRDIVTAFGDHVVHDGVSFSVKEGEIYGLLGGSGSGKTVLMREIILLNRPKSGEIRVGGKEILTLSESKSRRYGCSGGCCFSLVHCLAL